MTEQFTAADMADAQAKAFERGVDSVRAGAGLGGWLPIESAPKDEAVLIYCPLRGVRVGRWCSDQYAKKPRPYWTHDGEYVFGKAATRADQPAHWQPLPHAPHASA